MMSAEDVRTVRSLEVVPVTTTSWRVLSGAASDAVAGASWACTLDPQIAAATAALIAAPERSRVTVFCFLLTMTPSLRRLVAHVRRVRCRHRDRHERARLRDNPLFACSQHNPAAQPIAIPRCGRASIAAV